MLRRRSYAVSQPALRTLRPIDLVSTLCRTGLATSVGRGFFGTTSIGLNLSLNRRPVTLITQLHVTAPPLGVHEPIPKGEKGLCKVGFDSPALVMDIVISGIVGSDMLQRIPRECIATVVIDGFDGGCREEDHALPVGHASR